MCAKAAARGRSGSCRCVHRRERKSSKPRPGPPAKTGIARCARGQVSWLSDRPTPRTFPASRPVALAGFVPDYSDGVAADSHRLPWGPRGHPGANNAGTVPDDRPAPQGPVEARGRVSRSAAASPGARPGIEGCHGFAGASRDAMGGLGGPSRPPILLGRAPRARLGLARERRPRGRAPRLALQRALRGARAARGGLALAVLTGAVRRDGAAARSRRRGPLLGRRQLDAGPARLGEADGDGLLGRARAVLALAHVVDLLPHELAGLPGGTLALATVASGPFERSLLRHGPPPAAPACERCASDYAFLLDSLSA